MKSRHWFLISLLLLVAAVLCWRHGERLHERERERNQSRPAAPTSSAPASLWEKFTQLPRILTGRAPFALAPAPVTPTPELLSVNRDPRLPVAGPRGRRWK